MNYFIQENDWGNGFEIIYREDDLPETSNWYDTREEADEFIATLENTEE
jgi:hypothetical protein